MSKRLRTVQTEERVSQPKNKLQHRPSHDKTKLLVAFTVAVDTIRGIWEVFDELFLVSQKRSEVMRHFAQHTVSCVEGSLKTFLYMAIAQLNDPAETLNDPAKANLVLARVIDDLAPAPGTADRDAIDVDCATFRASAYPITKWRQKWGAHRDLLKALAVVDHLTAGAPHPLPEIPATTVKEAVNCLIRIAQALVNEHTPGKQWCVPSAAKREVEKFVRLFESAGANSLRSM
jgi:hypothetical protein